MAVALLLGATGTPAQSPDAVAYRLSFPERVHRLMDVEVIFPAVPEGPLELRMSRSSPGRYALHEFAKNVLDFRAFGSKGQPLPFRRPDPHAWIVTAHDGTVRVQYRLFGDRVDGTYVAVDTTHAHINMPATLVWARGFEARPASVRVERPPGTTWRVATQLLPGSDDLTFIAPNLAYLMDSPTEVSDHDLRTFTVSDRHGPATVHVAVHHDGTATEVTAFAADVERIVREMRQVFGEYPAFEAARRSYTFIADYLPWASGDGMEHRNSTVLTSESSIRANRLGLLDTVAHEFFHAWNVERIRPRALEPFDLDRANVSGELWLGEGFTSYYAPLVLRRAGLLNDAGFAREIGDLLDRVTTSPGRRVRSPREMSELAAFVDGATPLDRTNFENTYTSYYTWGAAIGLGLDLTLRTRSNGAVTLDHFMRELWQRHGRPGGREPGTVDRPYTLTDVETALAAVAGDAAFARDFLRRFVEGRELVEYQPLLAAAGIELRLRDPGGPSIGALQLQDARGGVRVVAPVPLGSPAYDAGLERDDVIVGLAGAAVTTTSDLFRLLQARSPGDTTTVRFLRRGVRVDASLRIVADPHLMARLLEEGGGTPTPAQRAFRSAWLGPQPDPVDGASQRNR